MNTLKYGVLVSCCALAACMEPTVPTAGVSVVNKKADVVLVNETFEQLADYTNPCNGEQIIGTARYHILVSVVNTKSGITMTNSDLDIKFTGVGVTTGLSYNGMQSSDANYSLGNGATEVSSEDKIKIVSAGNTQNFTATVRVHATINANGTPTAQHELVNSTCS